MVYEACRDLAEMIAAPGRKRQADAWPGKRPPSGMPRTADLWQEDKGFYRVHVHLDPLPHDFDEDDMFAMGGNAQAMISGLADAAESGPDHPNRP